MIGSALVFTLALLSADTGEVRITAGEFHRNILVLSHTDGLELRGEEGWAPVAISPPEGSVLLIAAHPAAQEAMEQASTYPAPSDATPTIPTRPDTSADEYRLAVEIQPTQTDRAQVQVKWGSYALRVRLPEGAKLRLLEPQGCTGTGIQIRRSPDGGWSYDLQQVDACPPTHPPARIRSVERQHGYLIATAQGYTDTARTLAQDVPFRQRAVP
jgi:hypothetical protein